MIKQYFDLLKKALTENDLIESPAQIYIMLMSRESHWTTDLQKLLQRKVRKRSDVVQVVIKSMIGCVSAAGQAVPPLVIFDAKRSGVLVKSLEHHMVYITMAGLTVNFFMVGWLSIF